MMPDMTMNASERFAAYLAGKPIDRAPVIEWAPWWGVTVERWKNDGLPAECAGYEALQDYFGLDKCIQTHVLPTTERTPAPPAFGAGILEDEDGYADVRPTLFPQYEDVFTDEWLAYLNRTHDRGDTLHFFTVEGFFWYPRTLFGIENHLYSFYDYPELYKTMCADYTDWLLGLLDYVFSRFRFDFMSFEEDMSYNNGPMISKEMFDEFLAPFYRKVIPVIHSFGIPVFIDSDGDITKAVDWYASVGADGMFPLERKAGVDVSLYIGKQPQMAFLGHFDKMCMKNGKDAMRAEFERILPSMLHGKVIPSVDHQTPPDVPLDYYKDYVSLLKEYAVKAAMRDKTLVPCPVTKG